MTADGHTKGSIDRDMLLQVMGERELAFASGEAVGWVSQPLSNWGKVLLNFRWALGRMRNRRNTMRKTRMRWRTTMIIMYDGDGDHDEDDDATDDGMMMLMMLMM
eukprot:3956844-Pyramimonas_sp.AAC.1